MFKILALKLNEDNYLKLDHLYISSVSGYCKSTVLGKEFSGHLSTTVSGRTCQRWDTDFPHDKSATNKNPANFEGGVFPENYCRNPDNEPSGPWCYTTDPDVRWEYCSVPICT